MRLLFLADAHLGRYKQFDENDSRLERCLDAMRQVFIASSYYECHAVIDCGDLIDAKNHIDFSVYNRIHELFRQQVVPYYALKGNHNMVNRVGDTNLKPMTDSIIEVAEPSVMQLEDVIVAFIPYFRSVEEWKAAYASVSERVAPMSGIKILVAHQEIQGAVTGTHRYVAKGGIEPIQQSAFTYAIFGHYHRCQTVGNAMYCGALLQQDFGEEGNHQGFWIFDTQAEQPWTQHMIETPSFVTVSLDDYRRNRDTLAGNFIRIRSEVDVESEIKEDPLTQVEVVPPIEHAPRLHVAVSEDIGGLVEAYIQQRVEPPIREEVRRLASQIITKE